MARLNRPQALIWAALVIQLVGFLVDAVWHGLLHPHFEPDSVALVVGHLATVHIVFLIGVVALFASTAWALMRQLQRAGPRLVMAVAFVGSLFQVIGQAWDLSGHLRLSHGPPMSWVLIFGGPLIVLGALLVSGHHRQEDQPKVAARHGG